MLALTVMGREIGTAQLWFAVVMVYTDFTMKLLRP